MSLPSAAPCLSWAIAGSAKLPTEPSTAIVKIVLIMCPPPLPNVLPALPKPDEFAALRPTKYARSLIGCAASHADAWQPRHRVNLRAAEFGGLVPFIAAFLLGREARFRHSSPG
jgi:hypothetical protein